LLKKFAPTQIAPDSLVLADPQVERQNTNMRIEMLIMKVLEIAFFTGLAGCAAVVLISWVVILKDTVKKDPPQQGSAAPR
jgi:hypothetical protein